MNIKGIPFDSPLYEFDEEQDAAYHDCQAVAVFFMKPKICPAAAERAAPGREPFVRCDPRCPTASAPPARVFVLSGHSSFAMNLLVAPAVAHLFSRFPGHVSRPNGKREIDHGTP